MIKCCFGCLDDACIPKLDTNGECWEPWDSGLIHSTIWKVTLGYITSKDSEFRWNSPKIKHLEFGIVYYSVITWIPTFFPGTFVYPLAKLDTYAHKTVWFLQVLPTALSCCLIGYMESIVWAPSWVREELSSDGPPGCVGYVRIASESTTFDQFFIWNTTPCCDDWKTALGIDGLGQDILPKTCSPWLKHYGESFSFSPSCNRCAFVVYPGGRQVYTNKVVQYTVNVFANTSMGIYWIWILSFQILYT